MNGLQAAQRLYDRLEPELVAFENYRGSIPASATDTEVEQFIAQIAETGGMYDELGLFIMASEIFQAIAQQWVADKEKVGQIIGPVFWRWASSSKQIELYGNAVTVERG